MAPAARLISALLITAVLAAGTVSRNAAWLSEVSIWEDAESKSPGRGRIYYNLGCIHARTKDFVRALAFFNRAIDLQSHYGEAYQKRGSALDDLGMHEEAILDYNRVIAMYPDFAEAYYDRGLAYERSGNLSRARYDYEQGCRLGDEFSCRALGRVSKL